MNNKYFTPITELPGDSGKSESAAAMVRYNRSTSPHKYSTNQQKQPKKDEYFQKIMTVEQTENSLFTPIASQQTIKKNATVVASNKYASQFVSKYAPQKSNVIAKSMSTQIKKAGTSRGIPGGEADKIILRFITDLIDSMDEAGTNIVRDLPNIPQKVIQEIAQTTGYKYKDVVNLLNERGTLVNAVHLLGEKAKDFATASTTPATASTAASSVTSLPPASIRGSQANAYFNWRASKPDPTTGAVRYSTTQDKADALMQALFGAAKYEEPIDTLTTNHRGPYESLLDWAERPSNKDTQLARAINYTYGHPDRSNYDPNAWLATVTELSGLLGGPVAMQNAKQWAQNLFSYNSQRKATQGIRDVQDFKGGKYSYESEGDRGYVIQQLATQMANNIRHAFDEADPIAARGKAKKWSDEAEKILSMPGYEPFRNMNWFKRWLATFDRADRVREVNAAQKLQRIAGDVGREIDNPPMKSNSLQRNALITSSIPAAALYYYREPLLNSAKNTYNYLFGDDNKKSTPVPDEGITTSETSPTPTQKPLSRTSSAGDIISNLSEQNSDFKP